jgi:hypothetical protein
MDFVERTLTDEEASAEMNRKKGRKSQWPETFAKVIEALAKSGCTLDKPFVKGYTFNDVKPATVVAGLNRAKVEKYGKDSTLRIRVGTDESTVIFQNSVTAK